MPQGKLSIGAVRSKGPHLGDQGAFAGREGDFVGFEVPVIQVSSLASVSDLFSV